MSSAVLERDTFSLPDDEGHVLQLVRVDQDGTRWATASALAEWLEVSERAVRKLANALGDSLATSSRNHGSATGGAVAGRRPVTVYSEDAWRLFAEHGRKARARAVAALFARWLSEEGRLARAEAKGPLPFARAVLGIAGKRIGDAAAELPADSSERELLDDVRARLSEDRRLIELAKGDAQIAEAALAKVAHALPRGDVDPDPTRSQRRKDQEKQKQLLALDGPVSRTTTATLRIDGNPIHTTTTTKRGNTT